MGIDDKKVARVQVTSAAWLCAMIALGCGGASGLQRGFQGAGGLEGEAAQPLLTEIRQLAPAGSVPGAVGVTGTGLAGRALPNGDRWEYTGAIDTLPIIHGGFVAFSGRDQVSLLDLNTGKPVWPRSLPAQGRKLSAMVHDGSNALLVLTDPDDSRAQLLVVVGADGEPKYQARSEPILGRPAALSGRALVPWDARYITVVDLTTGTTRGRLQIEGATTAVVAEPGGVLLLGQGVRRLEDAVAETRPASLGLPAKNLPGSPRWPVDGTLTLPPRGFPIAIYAHPTIEENEVRLAEGTFASTYHRVVLAFGAHHGELRWVTYFQRDVLGGATNPESVTLCLEDGTLWRLGWKDGSRTSSGSLETRLRACVVSPDDRPPDQAPRVPLAKQVASTLIDTGPDMAPAHRLLLDELSDNPSPDVTRLLVEIARSPRASADLAEQAARRIAQRRTGAEHLIAALEDSVDFDVSKRPPPLSAIASALFAMQSHDAAGPLARHLIDPRTSVIDQLVLARFLRVFATPEQVPELSEYFSLYRTAASEPELGRAVLLAAQTLWEVGGEAGRNIVLEAARDPMTHPEVRPELEKLIVAGPEPLPNQPAQIPPGVRHSSPRDELGREEQPAAPDVIHPKGREPPPASPGETE